MRVSVTDHVCKCTKSVEKRLTCQLSFLAFLVFSDFSQQCALLLLRISIFLLLFSLSKCEANVALLTGKSNFNTLQWSNCVITVTASYINFHSWVIKLQINQANRVVVFAISGPGCNVSSTHSKPIHAVFQESTATVWKQLSFFMFWMRDWMGALAEFSTM